MDKAPWHPERLCPCLGEQPLLPAKATLGSDICAGEPKEFAPRSKILPVRAAPASLTSELEGLSVPEGTRAPLASLVLFSAVGCL